MISAAFGCHHGGIPPSTSFWSTLRSSDDFFLSCVKLRSWNGRLQGTPALTRWRGVPQRILALRIIDTIDNGTDHDAAQPADAGAPQSPDAPHSRYALNAVEEEDTCSDVAGAPVHWVFYGKHCYWDPYPEQQISIGIDSVHHGQQRLPSHQCPLLNQNV